MQILALRSLGSNIFSFDIKIISPNSGPNQPSLNESIVILNVGGTIHQVKWDTIDKFPNSRLQRLRYATTESKMFYHCKHLNTIMFSLYSGDPLPLWLLLSGQQRVLLRQIPAGLREHPGPLPEGWTSPDWECLSQGLCWRAGVLGPQCSLSRALLCLHSPGKSWHWISTWSATVRPTPLLKLWLWCTGSAGSAGSAAHWNIIIKLVISRELPGSSPSWITEWTMMNKWELWSGLEMILNSFLVRLIISTGSAVLDYGASSGHSLRIRTPPRPRGCWWSSAPCSSSPP